MTSNFRYVLKNANTGQYLTESGWSSNISDAKIFDSSSDLTNLSTGYYIQEFVWVVV